MKNIILLILTVISLPSFARDFYSSAIEFSFNYANIRTGTFVFLDKVPAEVRYSDDRMFCMVMVSGFELECDLDMLHLYEDSRAVNARGTVTYTEANEKFGLDLLDSVQAEAQYKQLWTAMVQISREKRYELDDDGAYIQVEGSAPDSFHMIISDWGPATRL